MKKNERIAVMVLNHSAHRSAETIRSLREAFACEILFADSPDGVSAVLRQHHPPVALVSSTVRRADGIPILRFIHDISPDTAVIVMDEQKAPRALFAPPEPPGTSLLAKVALALEHSAAFNPAVVRR